jgi:hypothetical protein|tara:strand:- start:1192 stop:2094 length:903 start_codon:yes stop_codon:yes gene_type:complete
MTIKKTSDKNPTANLAINRSRIKKYGKNKSIPSYYLEKEQEFQIELYNPTQDKVLTTIKLNNKPISGGLVLRPGERVFLDRFLDSNKKFLFDTYKVDNTKSAKKAIEPNGDVEVAFFKEIVVPEQTFFMGGSGSVNLDWVPNFDGANYIDINYNGSSSGNTNLVNDNTGQVNYSTTNFSQDMFIPIRGNITSSDINSTTLGNNSITGRQGYASPNQGVKALKSKTPTTIETGRVEKGSDSDQNLFEATGNFELTSFHVLRYKLLPKSEKQLSAKDYYTKYCGGCGAKCKTKFCPYCGAKQ